MRTLSLYFRWRERIRLIPIVAEMIYLTQSLWHSHFGTLKTRVRDNPAGKTPPQHVALCCRIRDEARYLKEFVEYYLAAGVDHFFFYEKLSTDNFVDVLQPYIDKGIVSLSVDWPHIPVSPAAEQDCIARSLGTFRWVGFLDADEFVVIRDGRSIGEFLQGYESYPGVALNIYLYGSNGHRVKTAGPVILEYTLRQRMPDMHVKCFVKPESIAEYRNPHSWYYKGMKFAVNELTRRVAGSISLPPSATHAWINHYHYKSDEDYFEKTSRKSVQDKVGMRFATRSAERRTDGNSKANEVQDKCAAAYYFRRCAILNRIPALE